ncbi:MAG: acyl-CoA thioesterase [Gemmatimonadetes bacterium]|nr:acyl-CoA thioesterase [Gemmatimonadota bacterium]
MSTVPPIELTVRAGDCDAQGRISESAFVRLFEQARWEQIAHGPGMDLFARHGSRPVLRQANLEFRAPVGVGDRLSFETTLTHYGRTSFSFHQIARKEGAGVVADADVVLVCVTPAGEPAEVSRSSSAGGPRSAPATRSTWRCAAWRWRSMCRATGSPSCSSTAFRSTGPCGARSWPRSPGGAGSPRTSAAWA